MKRILVCGGRDFNDYAQLSQVLDTYADVHSGMYHPDDDWLPTDLTIIHGNARGADSLADKWAVNNYTGLEVYPADWQKNKKAAGPIRNKQMLVEGKPDVVLAFAGGRGTANMISQAHKAGVIVIEIPAGPTLVDGRYMSKVTGL
jgi:hypothetical protein